MAGTTGAAAGTTGAAAGTTGSGPITGAAGAAGSAAGATGGGGTVGPGGGTAGTSGAVDAGSGSTGDAGGMSDARNPVDAPMILDETLHARVVAGMVPLQAWYNTNTGLFEQNDWWTSGNQLTTVIDYTRETGDMKYFADIDNTFQKNKGSNFNRYGFYDDDGWWALVWIKAYDVAKQQAYLDMAKTVFNRMAGSWDTRCGGGIYWRNAKDKKNAISNALFMQAAAQLHLRTPGDTGAGSFIDWAQRTWTWLKASGMIRSDNIVIDTLDGLTTCKAAGGALTYNQGVMIGALVDLAASTGDAALLDQAGAIARATMASTMLNTNGIMSEPCGVGNKDCWQFKGVFFRNLLTFYRVRPAKDFQTYMRKQSDQIWNVARNAQNQFGYQWHLPFDGAAARRQSSALDALLAAYMASSPLP